ncbi:MAG: acyltransferase [Hyphomicrobium sp.]
MDPHCCESWGGILEFHQARAVAGTSEPASRPARFEIPFRADIEALRGIAVLAVVLYHAFPDVVRGGFLGVDVFFVLSGFLITQLLLRELEATGRIDLLAFWGRRFRRIAPAAIFVVLAVAALSFAFFALDGKRLGRHMIAAALSYYNWRQVSLSVDYLAKDDASNPLMHYWSLSVEEQFYVIWPLFLLCIVMLGARRPTLTICAALLAALSFALAMYFAATEPSRAFFGTDARAWQLLAGALVAMVPLRPVFAGKDIAAGAAIAVLALCCATMTGQPAAFALVPTIATAMVLWIGADWLAAPPLRYLGRVSFSWYLWHWR